MRTNSEQLNRRPLLITFGFSLTNESLDCQSQSQDILFDLHKKVIELANGDEIEVIHMGR